jgi:hypothetical protein
MEASTVPTTMGRWAKVRVAMVGGPLCESRNGKSFGKGGFSIAELAGRNYCLHSCEINGQLQPNQPEILFFSVEGIENWPGYGLAFIPPIIIPLQLL